MYVGVDIGGTKTLVAVLDEHGVIVERSKFPTPQDYGVFLEDLRKTAASLKIQDYMAGATGIPGSIDREHGIAIKLGNLPWRNSPIRNDFEEIFNCPIAIENDAKLGALSEAMLLKDTYNKVLYVTVSTGIGVGLVVNGVIDTNLADSGGRTIMIEHDGQMMSWEDFASGRAIVARYGKKASEITDETTWKAICRDLAKGFIHLIAIIQPEVIVVGGGVGTYFDRYGQFLQAEIEKYQIPLLKLPVLVEAQRPEEAVIYGCYDLAKQTFPHAKVHQ
jgi:predicted NBD/HSP70 family sugar kinase